MNTDPLLVTVGATQQSLRQRLDEATRMTAHGTDPRARQASIDAFAAATSRHLAAVEDVLLPETHRRLGAGDSHIEAYLPAARDLERALVRLKARLYGEQHVAHLPWPEVWHEVRSRLSRHNEAERALVAQLATFLTAGEAGAFADRVYRAEVKAPTRAHPYIPHTGLLGHLARRVWSLADRFWDTAEGRVLPMPVRPHPRDHSHDSLLSQYVTGEPRLDADAPLLGPRHHRHGRHHRDPDGAT